MKSEIMKSLKEYSKYVKYIYYTKKGLTITFKEDLTKLVKVQYKDINELKANFTSEIEKLIFDLKRAKRSN